MTARGILRLGRWPAVVAICGAMLFGLPIPASAAPGPLTITPIGWNVVGLDSNDVTAGPDSFPVGGRVCNTGSTAVTNLTVDWNWDTADPYIALTGFSQYTQVSLAAGACRDVYFNVRITRNSAAYDNSRDFHITADGDVVSPVSTPSPREIYVEKLVSQNRNAVNSWTLGNTAGCNPATGVVYVGSTCTATISSKTATGGYEQLVNAYYFNNSIFRIESILTTYNVPSGQTNTQMYADACGWDNNPSSVNYRSCVGPNLIGAGKVGGNPITTVVTFTVIGTGAQALSGLIYDFSGSSYHYNSDTGLPPNLLALTATYAPVAPDTDPDSATTNEDAFVDINVLSNDTDVNGNLNAASLSVATQPANGTASVVAGQVRYTPNANFNGTDTFTYQVCDSTAPTPLCTTETVTVTVNPLNDAPVAVGDADSTNEDVPVDIDVLTNDVEVDGDVLSVSSFAQGSNGTVTDNGDGTLKYTPNANFNGTDSFSYTVSDGNGGTDTATVTVTVASVNDVPIAVDDADATNEDVAVDVDVLTNDTDGDGDTLSVSLFGQGANGTVTDNGDGTLKYTPNANFNGTDSFNYTVSDGNGGTDVATVTVTINAVDDDPVANPDSTSLIEDGSVTFDVTSNDSDADGDLDPTTVTVVSPPSNGTLVDNGSGMFDYTPDADFSGTDSFVYQICDSEGNCDQATVTITVNEVNDAPTAADDADSVNEDSNVVVDVLANDTDPDDGLDATTVTVTSAPGDGVASPNPDGSITYTPDPDFFGSDTFTYQVCDFGGLCASAQVTVTVDAVNDPPTAGDDIAAVDEDAGPVNIDVLANDVDPEGNALTVTTAGPASNGSVTVNPNGTIDYQPDPDFFGTDTFTYQVCDPGNNCTTATVTVTVNALNDAPVANDDSDSTNEDTRVDIDVVANDVDVDGDVLTVDTFADGANGTVSLNVNGTLRYTPDPGWSGTDSFTYTVCDPDNSCDSATVTVDVGNVNDPPQATDDVSSAIWGVPVDIDVVGNDSDSDGSLDLSTLNVTSAPANGTATANGDGTIAYTADDNFVGTDTLTYQICDDGTPAECDTADLVITVSANPGPDAVDDTATVDEDAGPVNIDGLANDTDPDGGVLTVTSAGPAGNGTVTLNGNNTFDYDPDADFNGTDTFTYTVCDDEGLCTSATVTVTVNPVNDAPNAADDVDTVASGGTVNVDVLANDNDIDGPLDTSSVSLVTGPQHGTVSVNGNGTIDYAANGGYVGTDDFSYQVCDNAGLCATATVTITVTAIGGNQPPVAVDDAATTDEDTSVKVNVRTNDSDPDADPLSVGSFTQPTHGTVRAAGGGLRYTPDKNWNGTDTFTYQVCDTSAACDTATVTVVVDPVDDAPIARDDAISADAGEPVTIPVTGNDDDADSDALTVTVVVQPSNGTVTVNADGTIVYTSDGDFAGQDSFTYQICDPDGDCSTATVTVDVQAGTEPPDNPPPHHQPPDNQPAPHGDPPADEPLGGTLPHTGIELLQLLLWGVTFLAGGAALVSRRVRA